MSVAPHPLSWLGSARRRVRKTRLLLRILNPARHGDRAVVREHVAIEWIESGMINVGDEHTLAQIVEHGDARGTAQPAVLPRQSR
jgi:hypothetical protein